jgi:integrase/recombinase XerD
MGEQNLFRRGEIWWLRATVNGRDYRESLRTRNVRTARKIRDKRLEEIEAEVWHGTRRIEWKEAVAEWVKATASHFSPSTKRRYAVSLGQCEAILSPLTIDAIDGKTIAYLIDARRKGKASEATIRRDLTAISRVLEFAEGQGWREGNPTLSKRRTVKERRDPIELPAHDAIEMVIAAASREFGAFIRAAWLTGCRQAELARLTWSSYDERRGTLTIVGKGSKRRTIDLSPQATAHFSAQPRVLGSPLIFSREGGMPFAQAASDFCHLKRMVAAQAKREGREFIGFRFHDLRHLFAVEALHGGMGIYTLSKHLGHSSVATTEIYLAFLSPSEAEEARRGVGTKVGTAQAV